MLHMLARCAALAGRTIDLPELLVNESSATRHGPAEQRFS
jgi:hypothetical protein